MTPAEIAHLSAIIAGIRARVVTEHPAPVEGSVFIEFADARLLLQFLEENDLWA